MKLPDDVELAIVARYRGGASMREVAAAEYVAQSTVFRVLKRRDVRSRGHGTRQLMHVEYERTVALYRSGLSSPDVGRLLGVSGTAVRRRLRDAGEPRRNGGTPPRRLTEMELSQAKVEREPVQQIKGS